MRNDHQGQEPRSAHLVITYWGGAYPTQVQGTIDGHPFFFRERAGEWELAIVPPGEEPVGVWQAGGERCPVYWIERARWEEPRCDGYDDALRLIAHYANDFLARGWTHLPPRAAPDAPGSALRPADSDTEER